MEAGGPGDTVKFIIQNLGLSKPILFGYDWGAAIAMRLAIEKPNNFSHIISFHSVQLEDDMKKLKTPTLILWAKNDQNHPWKKFKPLADQIPNVTVKTIDPKPFNSEISKGMYAKSNTELLTSISIFVTGKDPSPKIQKVFNAVKLTGTSTKGQSISEIQGISIVDDLTEDQIEQMTEKPDAQKDAVLFFKNLIG
jgi:hypothetical protein